MNKDAKRNDPQYDGSYYTQKAEQKYRSCTPDEKQKIDKLTDRLKNSHTATRPTTDSQYDGSYYAEKAKARYDSATDEEKRKMDALFNKLKGTSSGTENK